MKLHLPLLAVVMVSTAVAQTPKIFAGLFEKGVPVRGQIGIILPPPEIDKYVAKVEAAARQDPKWFKEYSAKSKPGVPLPYDEKLGLTRDEYGEYLKLWAKREFKQTEKDVMLLLREGFGGTWILSGTGSAACLSTIRYDAAKDTFSSPNGELKRIADIKADPDSILGAWSGFEWKFEEESTLGRTKENLAIGKFDDNKFGLVVYRFQEVSSQGTPVVDKSLVVRFALGAAGHLKLPEGQAPAADAGAKPAAKPASKSSAKPAAGSKTSSKR